MVNYAITVEPSTEGGFFVVTLNGEQVACAVEYLNASDTAAMIERQQYEESENA